MTVVDLRNELKARNQSFKGLKSQLIARLNKILKAEAQKDGEETVEKENGDDVEMEAVPEEKEEKEKKVEVEEKKLDEQQKRLLEKRYTLPEQPHLIVHPSKTAKSGKFDCTTMSLSLLLDYRPEDTKEHSFEVSLFAELFNEMLMRDFGFNIFKALYELPQKPKEKEEDKKKKDDKKSDEKKKEKREEEKKDKKDDEKEKKSEESDSKKDKEDEDKKKEHIRDSKREDRKSDDSEDEEDDDQEDRKDKRDKDKKKKERVKLYTRDKHLLLSFVYFDQTHCGYIFDKDIEELLYTLGLSLSRSQVKKLVSKVVTRDSLHYRKLTDKPKEEEKDQEEAEEIQSAKAIDWHEIAQGNRKLLSIFSSDETSSVKKSSNEDAENSNSDSGLTVYQGAVVDIGKLLSQLERSEKARIETEQLMVDLKNENNKLSEKYSKSNSTIKHLTTEAKDYKEKLRSTEDALGRANAHAKLFQTTLIDIRDKIEPVLKTASHKEERKDKDRDSDKKKHDDGKSKWERDRDTVKRDTDKEVKKDQEIKKEPKEKDETKKETEPVKKKEQETDEKKEENQKSESTEKESK